MAFAPVCVKPSEFTLMAVTNVHREVSPYSFKQTVYDYMGDMWTASLQLYSMPARERATFLRWLVSLEGPKTPFQMPVFDYIGPFGTVTANPTIAQAATARANSVQVLLASGDIMAADDQITIDGHLHIVTEAGSKAGDIQQLTIWPRLRSDVVAGDVVEALAPYATWVLTQPQNGVSVSRRFIQSATLELAEAI